MKTLFKLSVTALFVISITSCGGSSESHDNKADAHGHGHDNHEPDEHGHHEEEAPKGPNGGTLLSKSDFSIELKIFETGTAPRLRIYAYDQMKALETSVFKVKVGLTRLAQKKNDLTFTESGDFYLSNEVVGEPHSFTVSVEAEHEGVKYDWHFDSFEGRTKIPDTVAKISGVKTEKASRREIGNVVKILGNILPSEHKIAHIIPRFSGIVKEGRKHIGDKAEKGEVLAIIESNQSLQPFEVKSQISGTVINGHLIPGEFVAENQWVYIVADISEVWGDFFIPVSELSAVKLNQKIEITTLDQESSVEGVISYIAPYIDKNSQSQMARVIIDNKDGTFLPGMFVVGKILTNTSSDNIAIRKTAIQNFNNNKSVFIKSGEIYEVRPIEIGKSGDDWIEVISGLNEGDEYVSENSFLIKADILKSGASHDH